MGSCLGRQPASRRHYQNRSDTREPLLKNDERQAVNNLLAYLDKGNASWDVWPAGYLSYMSLASRYDERASFKC